MECGRPPTVPVSWNNAMARYCIANIVMWTVPEVLKEIDAITFCLVGSSKPENISEICRHACIDIHSCTHADKRRHKPLELQISQAVRTGLEMNLHPLPKSGVEQMNAGKRLMGSALSSGRYGSQ
jgi:hypothetical protein